MQQIQPVSDKDPRRQLADLIHRARVGAEKSHRDVAQMCGVDQDMVKAWEESTDVPRGKQWTRLRAMLYHLRPAVLVWQAALRHHDLTEQEVAVEEEESREEAVEVKTAGSYVALPPGEITPPPPLQEARQQTTFGPALRIARLNIGITQEDLGQLLDVSGGTISQWETESNAPVLINWQRLVEAIPELKECAPPGVQNIRRFPRAATNPGTILPVPDDKPISGDRPVAMLQGKLILPAIPHQEPYPAEGSRDAIAKAGIAYAYALRDALDASKNVEKAKADLAIAKAEHDRAERRVHDAQVTLLSTVGAKKSNHQ